MWRATGVRSLPPGMGGFGLVEDAGFAGPLSRADTTLMDVHRQLLANGLTHISVTPMQVARAYAGLATGRLPDLRIIHGHEDRQKPRAAEPLPIEPHNLAIIHSSLLDVIHHPLGSAYGKGLDQRSLGFRLAAKTGSADYYSRGTVPDYPLTDRERFEWVPGVRKHTWVAGWFPAGDPKAIVVIYVHDTSTTSSHGAVYLASQFLRTPALREFLGEEGVKLDFLGGER